VAPHILRTFNGLALSASRSLGQRSLSRRCSAARRRLYVWR